MKKEDLKEIFKCENTMTEEESIIVDDICKMIERLDQLEKFVEIIRKHQTKDGIELKYIQVMAFNYNKKCWEVDENALKEMNLVKEVLL